jgi:hypothetical protein
VRTAAALLFVTLLSACGTPQAVKDLSTAQLNAFDAAVSAATVEGQALVALAQTYSQAAIADMQTKDRADQAKIQQNLAIQLGSASTDAQRQAALAQAAQNAMAVANAEAGTQATLKQSIAQIQAKANELTFFLSEMKKAQAALNTYLQSESIGDKLTQDILGSPLVQQQVGTVNTYLTDVQAATSQLKALVDSLAPSK